MTWFVDGRTFARKVKNPTYGVCGNNGRGRSIECPSCGYVLDERNLTPEWPGLPAGVKFDPSDQELIGHLATKVELDATKIHPFIDEFIPTLDGEDGICYTHPEKLPGVRHDGSSIHFFHRPARAYTTGTRKRRKVQVGDNNGNGYEMRWHKTGKTRPVVENGKQIGCKKIMVLYVSFGKKAKPNKANWVMHQYHLGVHEEEREGELVVSKVFYQTQPRQSGVGHKEDGDDFEHAVVELEEQRSHSFHYSSTSNFTTSINSQATPPAPKTPAPRQGQAIKQQRGLLATITEDVNRLNASLSAHSRNTVQSPDQIILAPGFVSTTLDCKSVSENQRAAYDSAQGSPDLRERDTCCSVERRGSRKENKHELINTSTTDGIQTSLVDHLCDMPSLEGHQFSDTIDSEVLKFLSNENLQMASKPKSKHDVAAQSVKGEVGETGCKVDGNNGEEGGCGVDSGLENIILDTPPEFLTESFMNSQETLDWLGKRKFWSDSSQKTSGSDDLNFLDFLRDSQSST